MPPQVKHDAYEKAGDLHGLDFDVPKKSCTGVKVFKGFESEHVIDYDSADATTFGVLCMGVGVVFRSKRLWRKQIMIIALFGASAYLFRFCHAELDQPSKAVATLNKLADLLMMLSTFLTSFYTSLSVSRWWRLRTEGVGNIWSASSQLSLLISQLATRDEEVLSAIRRYAQASLAIVFLKRRHPVDASQKLGQLADMGILTGEEVKKLEAWDNNLAESIWTWNMAIVCALREEGKLSARGQEMCQAAVMLGRSGAAVIGAQMGCPIPYPYVHIISFMTKMYTLTLAVSLGHAMALAKIEGDKLNMIFMVAKVMFVPMIYNAVLLMNEGLADPFGLQKNDWAMEKYVHTMETDGKSYISAGENLPNLALLNTLSNKKL